MTEKTRTLQKKCYSLYEEEGYTDDEYNCIRECYDNMTEEKFPFEVEIYVGDEIQFKPSHFCPRIEDRICDEVNDQCGEWSENWQSKIQYKSKKLNEDFEQWFDKWCEENDCKISFWNVDNVKKVTYTVRSLDDYEEKIK